jgi:glucan phosphoethanolaminetransferase (alkaline phosphatase superfamily)
MVWFIFTVKLNGFLYRSIKTIILLNYYSSKSGVLLHLVMLLALVVILYLLFRALSRFMNVGMPIIALTTGLVQFLLLGFYIANWMSFYFMHASLKFDIVSSHIHQAHQLASATGLSIRLITIFAVLLLLSCITLSFWIFSGAKDEKRSVRFLIIFLLLIPLSYSQLDYRRAKTEIIYSFFKGMPQHLAPSGLLLFEKPQLKTIYAKEHSKSITPRPLILISIDAIRSDAMQVYGSPTQNMPFLQSMLDRGEIHRFDNAKTVCNNSYCGIIGLLASRYWSQLDRTPDNLADALTDNGYENYFYLSGIHSAYYLLRQQYGKNVHFYKDGSSPGTENPNDDRNLLRWLNATELTDADRSFLWFHLMDVHQAGLRLRDGQVKVYDPAVHDQTIIRNMKVGKFVQRYHDGIRQSDDTIREIFSWLHKEGILDRAVVIITSDHGEFLGEHGLTGHFGHLWKEVTSVPLLIYDRQAKKWPARPVYSTVDVAPTFLEAIGAPIPLNWAGIPFQRQTERCAVPVEMINSRVLVGEVAGEKVKYWEIREKLRKQKSPIGEWLSFPDKTPEILKPIAGDDDRALVGKLHACFDEPRFVERP